MATITEANTNRRNRETPKRKKKPVGASVPRRGNPLALEDDLLTLARAVPREEWARLPDDLNENLDHYLYGSQRKPALRKRTA